MAPYTRRTTVIALIIFLAQPAWCQQYLLYAPQTVTSGQRPPSQEGILVQEIEIQKGDTLYALSRKFSGRGMYYPQILLFNSILNPNLIYTGKLLRIPVNQKEAHVSERVEMKPTGASPTPKAARGRKKTALRAKTTDSPESRPSAHPASPLPVAHKNIAATPPAADAAAGQKLFEAAVTAYRQDDCRAALTLLDRYLADNSGSPLAADANLYKAECYLKLSAQ